MEVKIFPKLLWFMIPVFGALPCSVFVSMYGISCITSGK